VLPSRDLCFDYGFVIADSDSGPRERGRANSSVVRVF
jgi:hypothetical protein